MINIDNIKGKYFIDTNVLIYSFDQDEPIKMAAAQNIIQHALFTHHDKTCAKTSFKLLRTDATNGCFHHMIKSCCN